MANAKFVDGVIPEEYQPNDIEHVSHPEVYRFVKDVPFDSSSFQPFIVDHPNFLKKFATLSDPRSAYGVSLFISIDAAKMAYLASTSLQKNTVGLARGHTDINRGISTKANPSGHVDYFLYDYINNSPADDFEFVIKNEDL